LAMSHKSRSNESDSTRSGADPARRRLLRLGAYVPPAVLGMMIVGGMPRDAQAVVGSCAPSACQPCIDMNNPALPPAKRNKKRRKCNKKRACFQRPGGCAPKCAKG